MESDSSRPEDRESGPDTRGTEPHRGSEHRAHAGGLGGLLKGLGQVVETLSELAASGETVSHTSTFGRGDGRNGVFDIQIRTRPLDESGSTASPTAEPTYHHHGPRDTSEKVTVQEVREPDVDVYEEGDHLVVIAEMPGISVEDLDCDVVGDVLTIHAEVNQNRYRREVLLPKPVEGSVVRVNNGIVEIKCPLST